MAEKEKELPEELKRDDPSETSDAKKKNGTRALSGGSSVTAGLVALVLLLLVFFLGMRLIDRRADKLAPTAAAEQTAEQTAKEDGRVNINTAPLEELTRLTGIGEKKARAIIDYRNEYGPFLTIEEIMRVDGIGSGIFEKIKDGICVS